MVLASEEVPVGLEEALDEATDVAVEGSEGAASTLGEEAEVSVYCIMW